MEKVSNSLEHKVPFPRLLDFDRAKSESYEPWSVEDANKLFQSVAFFGAIMSEEAIDAIWDVLNYGVSHDEIDGYWTKIGVDEESNQALNSFREATLDSDNCWIDRINDSSLSPSISAIRIFKDPGTFHKDFFTKTSEVLQDSKYSDYEKSVVAKLVEFFKASRLES